MQKLIFQRTLHIQNINCLLSVSITHDGLTSIAKEYLEGELKKGNKLENLNIFVITELLAPSATTYKLEEDEALGEQKVLIVMGKR